MENPQLNLLPIIEVNVVGSLAERFEAFHAANPQVYVAMKKLTHRISASGRNEYSIAGIFEVIRFSWAIQTRSLDDYKINNNYKPFYARLLNRDPEVPDGFFAERSAEADLWIDDYMRRAA